VAQDIGTAWGYDFPLESLSAFVLRIFFDCQRFNPALAYALDCDVPKAP
jgi:hypothetical protein